jgi:hypothetical protein
MELNLNINRYFSTTKTFKNEKDELVHLITEDINLLRQGTAYKPTTTRIIALRLNSNPFYAKDVGAIRELYELCKKRRNYSKLWADCPMYKKQ